MDKIYSLYIILTLMYIYPIIPRVEKPHSMEKRDKP